MNTEQLKQLEKALWSAANNLRANTDFNSTEYATPVLVLVLVLGLIFLKFADNNYARAEQAINAEFARLTGTRREKPIDEIAIEKCGFYLPPHARYDYLLNFPGQDDVAKKIKQAKLERHGYLFFLTPDLISTYPAYHGVNLKRLVFCIHMYYH